MRLEYYTFVAGIWLFWGFLYVLRESVSCPLATGFCFLWDLPLGTGFWFIGDLPFAKGF